MATDILLKTKWTISKVTSMQATVLFYSSHVMHRTAKCKKPNPTGEDILPSATDMVSILFVKSMAQQLKTISVKWYCATVNIRHFWGSKSATHEKIRDNQ